MDNNIGILNMLLTLADHLGIFKAIKIEMDLVKQQVIELMLKEVEIRARIRYLNLNGNMKSVLMVRKFHLGIKQ